MVGSTSMDGLGKGGSASSSGCKEDVTPELVLLVTQIAVVIGVVQILSIFLKPLGQPRVVAEVLAGFVVGPSGLCRIRMVETLLFPVKSLENLRIIANVARLYFMFLVGLELDPVYVSRTAKRAVGLAYGGAGACMLLAGVFSNVFLDLTDVKDSKYIISTLIFMLILANTASPILARMTADLKLATSEVGRVAISASIVNDLTCLILLAVLTFGFEPTSFGMTLVSVGLSGVCFLAIKPMIRWLNRRNPELTSLSNFQVSCILFLVAMVGIVGQMVGHSSVITAFILGLSFPREGRTTRTLIQKLHFPIYKMALPIYFGFTGLQMDMTIMHGWRSLAIVTTVVGLGTAGKIVGTLLAASGFNIPDHEALVIGLLLNVKGHVNLMVIQLARDRSVWDAETHMVLVLSTVVSTALTAPLVTAIVNSGRKTAPFRHAGIQWERPESELRILAAVHSPRNVSSIIKLIEASRGSPESLLAIYVMRLVELTNRTASDLLYHEQDKTQDMQTSVEGKQIMEALDDYSRESGVSIRQVTAISTYSNMHEDLCIGAEDTHAALVILPFHKHHRMDGKMDITKQEFRKLNQKVLQKAPCSVGIFVDRGATISSRQAWHHVAALFFGGPDDREALAYGSRIANHPHVSLTVIHFTSGTTTDYGADIETESAREGSVLMDISQHEREKELDGSFLSSFYRRYVVTGSVSYEEVNVENGAQTVDAIKAMEGKFGFFIVGRGENGISPLTSGMSDWQECPELGPIGDLMASSDFWDTGSVLVIQKHSDRERGKHHAAVDAEFMVS